MKENTTQERNHQKENVPQMIPQIHNHALPKMNQLLHISHKLKPSLNNNQKTHPLLSSSQKTTLSWNSKPKMIPHLRNSHRTCPYLNNNMLLLHLHLNPAMTVHFQTMAQNSNCFQQKIPVPYRRNRVTVYIRNLNRFNQFCLIFSLQIDKRNI